MPLPLTTLSLAGVLLVGLGVGGCSQASSACPPGDGLGSWMPLPRAAAPAPRYAHAFALLGGEVVAWGGIRADGTVAGDGAAFRPATLDWTTVPAAGAPSPRAEFAWVVAEAPGVPDALVVFGGQHAGTEGPRTAAELRGDGAVLRAGADQWTPLPAGPSPRFRAAMAADPATGRVYLVGGVTPDGPVVDAWQLDLALASPTWTQLQGSVPLHATPSGPAFNASIPRLFFRPVAGAPGQLVLVDGAGNGGVVARAASYLLPSGPWIMDDGVSAPPARAGAAVVFAPGPGVVILQGGTNIFREPGQDPDDYFSDVAIHVPRVPDPADPSRALQGTNTWTGACATRADGGVVLNVPFSSCGLELVSVTRAFHAAAWTGDGMLMGGGIDPGECGGAAFLDWATRSWVRTSFGNSPMRGRQAEMAAVPGVGVVAAGQHRPSSLSSLPLGGATWVP